MPKTAKDIKARSKKLKSTSVVPLPDDKHITITIATPETETTDLQFIFWGALVGFGMVVAVCTFLYAKQFRHIQYRLEYLNKKTASVEWTPPQTAQKTPQQAVYLETPQLHL